MTSIQLKNWNNIIRTVSIFTDGKNCFSIDPSPWLIQYLLHNRCLITVLFGPTDRSTILKLAFMLMWVQQGGHSNVLPLGIQSGITSQKATCNMRQERFGPWYLAFDESFLRNSQIYGWRLKAPLSERVQGRYKGEKFVECAVSGCTGGTRSPGEGWMEDLRQCSAV